MKDEDCFYMIWNPNKKSPSWDTTPRQRHLTEAAAIGEAERLAESNPGQKFYVMCALSVTVVDRPAITRPLRQPMPF